MSLFGLFDIGKSAIFASRAALDVTGHNIANVNTPGFSRQEAILEIATPVAVGNGYLGRGVIVSNVKRHYDRFIQAQLLSQRQSYGRSLALSGGLGQVEQVFNEARGIGLSGPLNDYFNAWQEVANNPEGQPQRTVLLQKGNALVQIAKRMERGLEDILRRTNEEINDTIDRANSLASEIAALNGRIAQVEGGDTNKANDLRDGRERLLGDLGELIEVNSFEGSNGRITVIVGQKNLVDGEKVIPLERVSDAEGNIAVYIDGVNVGQDLEKGRIAGLLALRGDIESTPLKGLRKLISSVTKEVNLLHRAGYGLDGSTGLDFFSPINIAYKDYSPQGYITSATVSNLSSLTLDEYDIRFDTATTYEVYNRNTGALVTSGAYTPGGNIDFDGIRVVVNGTPGAGDSFFITPLQDAIENFGVTITDIQKVAASATATGLPGDNNNALQFVRLSQNAVISNNTFANYYRSLVTSVGSMNRAATDSLTFEDRLLSDIQRRRDAVSSVSLDEEAANLIRFQRAFEAGARLIKVTDELLETLINL